MRLNFEKTAEGNPQQLTIRQHVQPRRWICEFAAVDDGRVRLYDKKKNKTNERHPNEDEFVV
jgi:predicted HD phosphohydrolase